jgi:hypothetical protein
MRKTNRVYTEDTYHGEAPDINSPEGKTLLDQDPELKESIGKLSLNSS